eukprot:COSAG01_NODE_52015_length_350_cov_0.521912_1_plen_77_part_01
MGEPAEIGAERSLFGVCRTGKAHGSQSPLPQSTALVVGIRCSQQSRRTHTTTQEVAQVLSPEGGRWRGAADVGTQTG